MSDNLNVLGGALEFVAGIQMDDRDIDKILAQVDKLTKDINDLAQKIKIDPKIDVAAATAQISAIEKELNKLTMSGLDTGRLYHTVEDLRKKLAGIKPVVIPAQVDTKAAFQSIETLRAKLLIKQQSFIENDDPAKVALLNKEITALEEAIQKIKNSGKEGFDDFGNKLADAAGNISKSGEAAEGAAKKTNILSKGFGFIRQAAYLIPGIGIAGIFNLIGDAVFALVKSIFQGAEAFDVLKEKMKLYNEIATEANKQAGAQISQLELLYKAATNVALSTETRISAARQLQALYPTTFAQHTEEAILVGKLSGEYKVLAKDIVDAARAKAAQNKLTDLSTQELDNNIKKEEELENLRQKAAKIRARGDQQVTDMDANTVTFSVAELVETEKQKTLGELHVLDEVGRQIKQKKDIVTKLAGIDNLVNPNTSKKEANSTDDLRQRLGQLQAQLDALSPTAERYAGILKQIKDIETELAKRNKAASPEKTHHEAINKLIAQRVSLVAQIRDLEVSSLRSGLLKEPSALEAINHKYDEIIIKAKAFNAAVLANPNKNKGIDLLNIGSIEKNRDIELQNETYKQNAEEYLKNLDVQKNAFEQYENAKRVIGEKNTNELLGLQLSAVKTYRDFLERELLNLDLKSKMGLSTIEDDLKRQGLKLELKLEIERESQRKVQDFIRVLQNTASFNDKRQEIEQRYNEQYKILSENRGKMSKVEYEDRVTALKKSQAEEEEALRNSVLRQSSIYKKLSTDIVGFSREGIKDLIDQIEAEIKTGFTTIGSGSDTERVIITPVMLKDFESLLNKLKGVYKETADLGKLSIQQLNDLAGTAQKISGSFSSLSDTLNPVSKKLSGLFAQLSGISSAAGNAITGLASLRKAQGFLNEADKLKGSAKTDALNSAAGSYADAASAIVSAVSFIVKLSTTLLNNIKAVQKEIADFNLQILTGEVDVNIQYRERLALQSKINKLKLDGLKAEQQQLEANKANSIAAYNQLLALLYGENAIVGKHEKKKSIFARNIFELASGKSGSIEYEFESLAGKSFEQLEALFMKGQLTNKAKELFQSLQKLKQEGIDIDKQLEDLKAQQNEIFTGTTSSAIADSILEGFKQGKRGIADFADTFHDLMRNAIFSALDAKAIQPFATEFYNLFASLSGDADGLTNIDIDSLEKFFGTGMEGITKQLNAFQSLASKLNFGTSNAGNALSGAIKGITEQQADLLAGQFGGIRITLIEQNRILVDHLNTAIKIERNTALTATNTALTVDILNNFKNFGIKIKP